MKYLYTLVSVLLLATSTSAQGVEAITSINYYGGDGFDPQGITVCNGSLFFYGILNGRYINDSVFNNLYISDGTPGNATLVKTINSVSNYTMGNMHEHNNRIIFSDTHAKALWSSDGTAAGTNPYAGVLPFIPFTEMNGKLYFAGTNDTANYDPFNIVDQLWVTDGTTAGTTLVKAINPTGAANIRSIYAWNGNIYFQATDGVNGIQLWTSDGTPSGTHLLKTINSATTTTYISSYTSYNNKLYFSVNDSVDNYNLWESDGTNAGTQQITHYGGTFGLDAENYVIFNNKLFFSGFDSTGQRQLWTSDGTAGGTSVVHAEQPGGFAPSNFTIYNNMLYLLGADSAHGYQIWKTDGTTPGTQLVSHRFYGFNYTTYPNLMTTLYGKLIFVGWDSVAGFPNVFIGDGTDAGSLSYSIPGAYNTDFKFTNGFVPFNGALYYNASYFTTLDYQVDRVLVFPDGIATTSATHIEVFPNPANSYLQFHSDMSLTDVHITDLSGRVVLSTTSLSANKIQVAGLAPGLYVVQATDDAGHSYTGKFVKE